jgi:hypothetical protein
MHCPETNTGYSAECKRLAGWRKLSINCLAKANRLSCGNQQLAASNWQLAIGIWQLAFGNLQLAIGKNEDKPETTKDTKEHGGEQTTVEHSEVVSKKFRKKFRSPDC